MIGARLGKWVLVRELGKGGMGSVYLAENAEGEQAAIKVLAPELTSHAGSVNRFKREIEVLSRLAHANIVRLIESGEHDRLLYYVMEYVAGDDFARLVVEQGRLPWNEGLRLAIDVCAALHHAHAHGVVHRDLKPSNLIRTPDGGVKLADFGVAHLFAAEGLTRPGAVVGTAEYLSPEQAAGKPSTPRSDLYSLGVVLYTLITGRNPFVGANIVDVLHKHRYAQFDRPGKFVPDLPPEFEDLICQLMEKDPERRPADAAVLGRRLEALRQRLTYRTDQTYAMLPNEPTRHAEATPAPECASEEGQPRREGEATFVSRMVRKELDSQNKGGPLRQFLNRPPVLVTLFVLCVAGIVYGLWPLSPETLFARGVALAETDLHGAFDKYFDKLEKNHPNHNYKEEVAEYRNLLAAEKAQRGRGRRGAAVSEAQWFYLVGLRQRQQGDEKAARQTWDDLARAFRGVDGEETWVDLAEAERAAKPADDSARLKALRATLKQVEKLRDDGKAAEADAALASLKRLYANDAAARPLLEEAKR